MLPAGEDGSLEIFARLLVAVMLAGVVAGAVLVPHVLVEPKPAQGLDLAAPRITTPPVVVTVPIPAPQQHTAPRKTPPALPITHVTHVVKRTIKVSGTHETRPAPTPSTPIPHRRKRAKPRIRRHVPPPPTTTTTTTTTTTAATTTVVVAIPLSAGTTVCNGTYRGTGKNVTVPSGATCVLTAGTNVTHDVTVTPGATLIDPTVTIRHDLIAQNPAGIVISGDSIGHDLRIDGLSGSATQAGNNVCDTDVGHDLVVDGGLGSAGALLVGCPDDGNTVGHDLVVAGNANAIVITGNSVGHDLVVSGNANAVVGDGNTVGHDLRVDGATTSHDGEGAAGTQQQQQQPPPKKPNPGPKSTAAPADRPPPAPKPHDD